jgi:hypothetical protein
MGSGRYGLKELINTCTRLRWLRRLWLLHEVWLRRLLLLLGCGWREQLRLRVPLQCCVWPSSSWANDQRSQTNGRAAK